jgi:hypothetical protein
MFLPAKAAENWVAFNASPTGSRVKIDGTSTLHAWTMESQLVSGKLEFEPGFQLDSALKPGKIQVRGQISMPVRQFKSTKDSMDQVMQQAMKSDQFPKIEFRVTELELKESPKAAEGLFQFDSKGELIIAGVTNKISMPVTILRVSPVRIKVSGSTNLKMTAYGITPPAPKLAAGALTTGDDVKITFDWVATQRSEPKP